MKSFTAIIQDSAGLHARPATMLVKAANMYKSKIQIKSSNGSTGDAKSIINLLALGLKFNESFEVIVEGEDEDMAIEGIKNSLQENKII